MGLAALLPPPTPQPTCTHAPSQSRGRQVMNPKRMDQYQPSCAAETVMQRLLGNAKPRPAPLVGAARCGLGLGQARNNLAHR